MGVEKSVKRVHKLFLKLQNLYNDLLNELFEVVPNKSEVERLFIEKVNSLNEFQLIILPILEIAVNQNQNQNQRALTQNNNITQDVFLTSKLTVAEIANILRQVFISAENSEELGKLKRKVEKIYRITYKIIKTTTFYEVEVINVLVAILPIPFIFIAVELFEEIIVYLDANIVQFKLVDQFKYAKKLKKIRNQVVKFLEELRPLVPVI